MGKSRIRVRPWRPDAEKERRKSYKVNEIFITVIGDSETAQWVDSLVSNGLLEEVQPLSHGERCVRLTQKGDQLLELAVGLSRLNEQGWRDQVPM